MLTFMLKNSRVQTDLANFSVHKSLGGKLHFSSLSLVKKQSLHKNRSFFNIPNTKPKVGVIKNTGELNLFGIKFNFVEGKIVRLPYHYKILDIFAIGDAIEQTFVDINKKGFMDASSLLHPMFGQLQLYFKSLGLKVNSNLTLIGASENTYTLWVN
jgi:hypothetical protein